MMPAPHRESPRVARAGVPGARLQSGDSLAALASGRGDEKPSRAGFTLIEVVAALVVFSLGVLLTTGLTAALSIRMQQASLRSEVVAVAQEQMEALSLVPYESLEEGTTVDSIQVQGRGFSRTLLIRTDPLNPVLREIRLDVDPLVSPGPSFRMITFSAPRR